MSVAQRGEQVNRPNRREFLPASKLSRTRQICISVLVLTGLTFMSALAENRDGPNEFFKLRTGRSEFRYFELGRHVPYRSGRENFPLARFVAAPNIGLPIKVDPKHGVHMYCNSQVYGLGGFHKPVGPGVPTVGVNSAMNYQFPWTSNFCEKRGRGGDQKQLEACGTAYVEHLGQDCRPAKPVNRGFQGIAVADGLVSALGRSHLVTLSNKKHLWTYLHMDNRVVRRGQIVHKGQKLGLISNRPGNTSIHLHLELQLKGPDGYHYVDPLPSLIVAYRKALGHDTSDLIDENGNLRYDPVYEIKAKDGSGPDDARPCATALQKAGIGTERRFKFESLWCHNNSVLGLVVTDATRKFVYFKPRREMATAASRQPVLIEATSVEKEWRGNATHYSTVCGEHTFPVRGTRSPSGALVTLRGLRKSFQNRDCEAVKVQEVLIFERLENNSPTPVFSTRQEGDDELMVPQTSQHARNTKCPYAVERGEPPILTGTKASRPKSERTCNFAALTLPRNKSLAQMPRYIREWPGLNPSMFIDDADKNQIIAFDSVQSGTGAWWYWIINRARNGRRLEKLGFGRSGRPTLRELSLAMSGQTTVTSSVRKTYLGPYLKFARQYFGRRLREDEPIDLADDDNRWNLARTLFRLESGREPVMSRRTFECGVEFGDDIISDFDAAGVERGATDPIKFVRFKGEEYYATDCLSISEEIPFPLAEVDRAPVAQQSNLAAAEAMIVAQRERIKQLTADLAKLRVEIVEKELAIAKVRDELVKATKNHKQ